MAGSARDEAERLVAAVLAMATGSAGKPPAEGSAGSEAGSASGSGDAASARSSDSAGPAGGGARSTGTGGGAAGSGAWSDRAVSAGFSFLGDSVAGLVRQLTDQPSGHRAGARQQGGGWATGSAECCVCPVCRAIAATRDPSPGATERLATGAGDLAAGVASMMRAVSVLAGDRPRRPSRPPARPQPGNADETWSTATRAPEARNRPDTAWSAATNPAARSSGGESATGGGPAGTGSSAESTAAGGPAGGDLGDDPWAAATTASAAAVDAERAAAKAAQLAAAQAARRAAAEAAAARAAEAARRVEEAVALAKAARESADAGGQGAVAGAGSAAGPVGSGAAGMGTGAGHPRTARGFDVWAAATAEAGVADVAQAATVDHDVAGDEARGSAE